MQDTASNKQLNPNGKKKFEMTYNRQKLFWAVIFLLPWFLGLMLLFVVPFFQSLNYSFYKLTPQVGSILFEHVGFGNYIFAFNEHVSTGTNTSFSVELINTMTDVAFNIPVLLIFSLFMAVLLNMKFKGRAIVRAIFFVPVILNSVAVASALGGGDRKSTRLNSSHVRI